MELPLRTVAGTILLLAGIGSLGPGLLVQRGESTSPAERSFAIMIGITGLSGAILGGLAIAGATRTQYHAATGSLWLFLAVPWIVFATTYLDTARESRRSRRE